MDVKQDWKDAGKDIGKTVVGLGKAIVRSVKVGADKILDEGPKDGSDDACLRDSWSEVGHGFGRAGKSLGKAVAETARDVADKLDSTDEAPKDGETVEGTAEEIRCDCEEQKEECCCEEKAGEPQAEEKCCCCEEKAEEPQEEKCCCCEEKAEEPKAGGEMLLLRGKGRGAESRGVMKTPAGGLMKK